MFTGDRAGQPVSHLSSTNSNPQKPNVSKTKLNPLFPVQDAVS